MVEENDVEIVYEHAKDFYRMIKALGKVMERGQFTVENGLTIGGMDEGRTAMATLKMPKDVFAKYEATTSFDGGVNIQRLKNITQRASKSDRLRITFNSTNDTLCFLIYELQDGEVAFRREFTLPLMEVGKTPPDIEKLQFTVKLWLEPSYLKKIIDDAKVFADSIRILAKKEAREVQFSARTKFGAKYEHKANLDERDIYKYEVENDTYGMYSLEHLEDLVFPAKLAEEVELKYAEDNPLLQRFALENGIKIECVLAPRVE